MTYFYRPWCMNDGSLGLCVLRVSKIYSTNINFKERWLFQKMVTTCVHPWYNTLTRNTLISTNYEISKHLNRNIIINDHPKKAKY